MAQTSSKAELIAFLTARGPDLLQSRGGTPTLTQHDVAAMFRHLSDKEQSLLLAKYALDTTARHKSWAYLYKEISNRKWNRAENLATVLLNEFLSDLICRTCGGIGKVLAESKIVECNTCGGMGRRSWSNREVARQLNLKGKLQSPVKERVEWIRKHLRMTEQGALERLK